MREAPAGDDSCSGYLAADARSIEMTGVAPADVLEGLRGELQTWRDWFEGNVVGWMVTAPDGAVIESVWGYYPDAPADGSDGFDYCRQEAREAAEHERAQMDAAARAGIPTIGRETR